MEETLLIFIKNPALGKVKTRLAKTVGDDAALDTYLFLLEKTRHVSLQTLVQRWVYYSDFLDEHDAWQLPFFVKKLQHQGNLGERMAAAFQSAFAAGAKRVAIIGSDCPDISAEILTQSFSLLRESEVVIGPSTDGGYYLLGMQQYYPEFFENITWSTDQVLPATLEIARQLGVSCALLPVLTDVDTEADWLDYLNRVG